MPNLLPTCRIQLRPIAGALLLLQLICALGQEPLHQLYHQWAAASEEAPGGCACHCHLPAPAAPNQNSLEIGGDRPFVRCLSNDCPWQRSFQQEGLALLEVSSIDEDLSIAVILDLALPFVEIRRDGSYRPRAPPSQCCA